MVSERLRLFLVKLPSERLRLLPVMVSERLRLLPEFVSERLRRFRVMFLSERLRLLPEMFSERLRLLPETFLFPSFSSDSCRRFGTPVVLPGFRPRVRLR